MGRPGPLSRARHCSCQQHLGASSAGRRPVPVWAVTSHGHLHRGPAARSSWGAVCRRRFEGLPCPPSRAAARRSFLAAGASTATTGGSGLWMAFWAAPYRPMRSKGRSGTALGPSSFPPRPRGPSGAAARLTNATRQTGQRGERPLPVHGRSPMAAPGPTTSETGSLLLVNAGCWSMAKGAWTRVPGATSHIRICSVPMRRT